MSTRPTQDWAPLGWSMDPVPGEPDDVAATATSFGDTGNSVDAAAQNLRRLNATETRSDAVTKIVQSSIQLATQLEEVRDRYSQASQALAGYAPALRQAQADSLAALNEATAASGQARSCQSAVLSNYQSAKHATTPDQQAQWATAMNQAAVRRDSALQSVAAARAKLQQAIDTRDSAASSATAQIEGSIKGSPLNDSGWDKLINFIQPALDVIEKAAKWVWKNIDTIALALTALAFVLSWVPGLDVALAILAKAAQALSTIKSGLQVAQDVALGLKSGKWTPLLADGGVMLFSFLGGKAAAKALEKAGRSGAVGALSRESTDKFTALKSKIASVVTDLRGGNAQSAERDIAASKLHVGVEPAENASTVDRLFSGESLPSILRGPPPRPGINGRFEVPPRDVWLSVGVPKVLQDLPLVPERLPLLQRPILPDVVDQSVQYVIQRWLSPHGDAYRDRIESQVCAAR